MSCRTSHLLFVAVLAVTGCATTNPGPRSDAVKRRDQALHAMRDGLAALRAGDFELAERQLGLAVEDVDSLVGGSVEARRAMGKFSKEQEKWFKGESYERSALFVYRGLLYLRQHDFGNAAACFKRAQLYDITGDDAPDFAGDWYSAEWLLALASWKQGFPEDAEAALKRAATFSTRQGNVPLPTRDANVLLVIENGTGPIKYRSGQYGESMRYREIPPVVKTVEVSRPGAPTIRPDPAESLWVQATTRGTRQVDAILAGKAQFKTGTQAAAVGLATGAVIASHHRNDTATGVLAGLALLSAGLSAATTPEADIRTWDNLPGQIYCVALKLPEGESELTVTGRNAAGSAVRVREFKPVIRGDVPLTVLFVRF